VKVVAQASNHKETEVGGRIYRARDGIFEMPEAVARHTVKYEGGQWPALSGHARRKDGYRCPSCGFGSFFKSCSRCHSKCAREDIAA
jgi:hypothetical protein